MTTIRLSNDEAQLVVDELLNAAERNDNAGHQAFCKRVASRVLEASRGEDDLAPVSFTEFLARARASSVGGV